MLYTILTNIKVIYFFFKDDIYITPYIKYTGILSG